MIEMDMGEQDILDLVYSQLLQGIKQGTDSCRGTWVDDQSPIVVVHYPAPYELGETPSGQIEVDKE